jgi:hypothetical protein
MRALVVVAAVAFLLSVTTPLTAKPNADGIYTVMGVGVASCGTWTTNHSANDDGARIQDEWIFGYLSAFNAWAPGTNNVTGDTDNAGATAWVTNYCSAHPLDTVAAAATALLAALVKH